MATFLTCLLISHSSLCVLCVQNFAGKAVDFLILLARRKPGEENTVTSSLNEITTDQLENRMVVREEVLLRPPQLLSTDGLLDSN